MERLVWFIRADASSYSNDLALALDLATHTPNLCGVELDDFFNKLASGKGDSLSPEELSSIQSKLKLPDRKLDLWVTLYAQQLDLPIREHLQQCDVMTLWTWRAKDINSLPQNLERAKKLCPSCRIVLGCYMWDYGDVNIQSTPFKIS